MLSIIKGRLKTLFNTVEARFKIIKKTLLTMLYDDVQMDQLTARNEEKHTKIYAVTIKICEGVCNACEHT